REGHRQAAVRIRPQGVRDRARADPVVLPESLTACRGAWALGYLPFAAPSFDLVCFGFLGVLAFLSIGCSSAMPWVRSILPRPGHDGTAPPTAGGCRAQVATGTSLRQRSG